MRKTLLALLIALGVGSIARADEGMWLLEQLSKKYPELVKRGLLMKEYDLYNPNGTSLKDAVVSFDGGCTGEIISSQGLVLTNHHCGYDASRSSAVSSTTTLRTASGRRASPKSSPLRASS